MKICTKDTEEVRGLRYEDLEVGDVFRLETSQRGEVVAIRSSEGYVYLAHSRNPHLLGMTFHKPSSTARIDTTTLTRYPNACIVLGDPE